MKWFDWVCIAIVAGFALRLVAEFFIVPGAAMGAAFIIGFLLMCYIIIKWDKSENEYYEMRYEKRREQVRKWKEGKK